MKCFDANYNCTTAVGLYNETEINSKLAPVLIMQTLICYGHLFLKVVLDSRTV